MSRTSVPFVKAPDLKQAPRRGAAGVFLSRPYLAALVLFTLTLVVFWHVEDHGFVWDDASNIEKNSGVISGFSQVKQFWQAPYQSLYIPLTYTVWTGISELTQSLQRDSKSDKLDPRLFHICNLLLHASSALVVYAILRKLFPGEWAAAGGALLFALHPIQVEPVAWITGMKDVLCGLLSLIAVWQYLLYRQPRSVPESHAALTHDARAKGKRLGTCFHYSFATFSFLLALLSKPTASALPLVVFMLDHWVLKRTVRQAATALFPWLAIAVPFVAATKLSQPDTVLGFVTPFWARPLIAADALAFYLTKLAVPVWLGPGYGRAPQLAMDEGWIYYTWLLPSLLALTLWLLRRQTVLIASAGIFVSALLPVSGIIPFQYQNISTVADRYLYLSMLGPALALAWFLSRQRKKIVTIGCGLVLLWMGVYSSFQARVWHDQVSLWKYALSIGQTSIIIYNNLAAGLIARGEIEPAINLLKQAVEMKPDYPEARYNLGLALHRAGRLDEAAEQLLYLISITPSSTNGHFLLGNVLADQHKFDEAISQYRQVSRMDPADGNVRNVLANTLADRGLLDEAIENYHEAIKINPNYAGAHFNLGIALADRGNLDEAAREYRTVLQIQPNHANAHNNLADILSRQGQRESAIDHFRQALRLRPDFPEAQRGLARLLGETGNAQ
jgi:protein O-mannosyl-transferase